MIIGGLSVGMLSTFLPVLVGDHRNSYQLLRSRPGRFQHGLIRDRDPRCRHAVDLGITLATDAYGPVA